MSRNCWGEKSAAPKNLYRNVRTSRRTSLDLNLSTSPPSAVNMGLNRYAQGKRAATQTAQQTLILFQLLARAEAGTTAVSLPTSRAFHAYRVQFGVAESTNFNIDRFSGMSTPAPESSVNRFPKVVSQNKKKVSIKSNRWERGAIKAFYTTEFKVTRVGASLTSL